MMFLTVARKVVITYLVCGVGIFIWWTVDWHSRTGQWRGITATVFVGPVVIVLWPLAAKFIYQELHAHNA